jgi:hypothetical protein
MSLKEKWMNLADELNFKFHPGIDALLESPHMEQILRDEFPDKMLDFEKASNFLNNPIVKGMMAKAFLGMASGSFQDYDFLVYPSSSSSSSGSRTYYVNTVLFFKNPYNHDMHITTANFFSKIQKKISPSAFIKTTNPKLNASLLIKGKNKDQIQTLLSYKKLQSQLIKLFNFSKYTKITDYGIRIKIPSKILPKETIIPHMQIMSETAKVFY